MTDHDTSLRHALDYYDRGLMVVPTQRVIAVRDGRAVCSCASRDLCPSPGKHPALAWAEFQRRRPSRDEVAEWWAGDRARLGVGILTGAVSGNIFVLDVDVGPGKDGDDSLRALQMANDDLPETAEVRTGSGGRHLYFRAPAGVAVVRNSAGKLGPGLDIRGEGGFVVAPPSVHASGQPYVWSWQNTLGDGIADAPAWLLDLVRADAPTPGAAPRERAPVEPLQRPAGAGSTGGLEPPVDDGREAYMRDTVHAVGIQLTGEHGAWPTADEIAEVAWPQFRRRVDLSRPGRISADNAEDEMRAKCATWARKAEAGGFGTLEDVVAGYQGRRKADPRQGPGSRPEEPSGNTGRFEAAEEEARTHFPLLYATDITVSDTTVDFVEGLLCEGALAVVYGDSNVGKTFLVLDVAMHVALGIPWRGREVDQGAVVYCALEGVSGIRNRVAAWMRFHRRHSQDRREIPFAAVPSVINLLNSDADVEGLIETILAASANLGRPVRLVVIDTLSRALAGGNENASEDMGALVKSADRIRQATGAMVLFVHHSGKDAARGARGHSLLRAATDTEIEIIRPEGSEVATIKVQKQRELDMDDPGAFRLEVVELGTNRRGKPLTSCVAVAAEAPPEAPKRSRLGSAAAIGRQALENALAKSGTRTQRDNVPLGVPVVPVEVWRREAYEMGISTGDAEARKKAFQRATEKLVGDKIAAIYGDVAWLC